MVNLFIVLFCLGFGSLAIYMDQANIAMLIFGAGLIFFSIKYSRVTDPLAKDFEAFHAEQDVKQAGIDARNYEEQVRRSDLIVIATTKKVIKLEKINSHPSYQVRAKIMQQLQPLNISQANPISTELSILSQHKVKIGQVNIWFLKHHEKGYRSIHRRHWVLWEPRHLPLFKHYLNQSKQDQ